MELTEDVRHEDEVRRTWSGGDVGLHPVCTGRQLTSGRDHLRLGLDERQLLEGGPRSDGRPGRNARSSTDVEQRTRRPVWPLPLHLAKDRRRRCERGRRAVGEIGGHGGAAARSARPVLATVGRREPFDLRRDGAARLCDEPLDRRGELRWERDGYGWEGSAASTSSAWVSGFTRRSSLATLPSASITKVERSTPMYVLPA